MSGTGSLLDVRDRVSQEDIDDLLEGIKTSKEFKNLDVIAGKRSYAVIVECLDNLSKYAVVLPDHRSPCKPFVTASAGDDSIFIRTGNAIPVTKISDLTCRLDSINRRGVPELTTLYEKIINKETVNGENGAGLGFVVMRLKSSGRINYYFTRIDDDYSFFEIEITVKRYMMRKLIIDRTASSPGVVLDPERRIFEISGESRPHDVSGFYGEILGWFSEYASHLGQTDAGGKLVFDFDLEYFNSSSAKYILDFCKRLSEERSGGREIEVRWKYERDDADMLEAGREMSRIAKLPFEYVKKESE